MTCYGLHILEVMILIGIGLLLMVIYDNITTM